MNWLPTLSRKVVQVRRISRAFSFAVIIGLLCVASTATFAQQGPQLDILTAENRPLASLATAAIAARAAAPQTPAAAEVRNFYPAADLRTQVAGAVMQADPLLAPFTPSAPASVLTQFDGSDNLDNAAAVSLYINPPDTNGEVSSDATNRFVQMINLVTTVFDKNGNELGGGPFPNSALWNGFGGVCENTDQGDPVILYDEAADRWFYSVFAFNNGPAAPFTQCIAVSQTSDPLGAYNRYAWDFSPLGLNDYPHFGITTNAIGVQINLFTVPGFGFAGTWIGTIDKACVYAGGVGCVLVGGNLGLAEFGHLPFDYDNWGAAGFVPAQFGTAMTASGLFDIWTITPDFATPANTTIVRTSRVPIATFDNDLCVASRERCVPHPGGGDDLETLAGRLMHRAQVTNHGTHLSMVAAHTVDAAAAVPGVPGRAGIRWYELRSADNGATWTLHQEGTHGPADGIHRWMPSIAMNSQGEIGLGYMASNAATPVGIRVTGQSAGSGGNLLQIGAPGVFDVAETTCRAGVTGSDWSGRSGDYSTTTVDPTSGTFWHTNQFNQTAGVPGFATRFGWGTAVCEFSIPAPGVYVLDGFGGVSSGGGAPVMSPAAPYFGFDVARDMELAATGYYVLDGWGGLHSGGGAPAMAGPPYFGFDASADLELASTGNYALDIFGGVHANAGAPTLSPATPYFGFDAARDFELAPSGGYYVFDAWGGLHFGGGATRLSPLPPYFGFDASQDIETVPGGVYALDSFGGVHAVGAAPALMTPPPYFGFDVARDMELAGKGVYVLDGWGIIHAGNGATPISPTTPYYGFDIAKDLEIR